MQKPTPKDTGGQYHLPLQYFATSGATICGEQHNPVLEDIQGARTGDLTRKCHMGKSPQRGNGET